jgi:cobalt-zinc-cadmium efflux system outer membrane protein
MRSALPGAFRPLGLACALLLGPAVSVQAQALDSLMALARHSSPSVSAAEARVRAARAGVSPAAALPDPMLMAGVVNLPLGSPGFRDEMTMKMLGIEQTLPFPGKRGLRRKVAEHEVAAVEAALDDARRAAARDVGAAYFEAALADSLERLVERQHRLLLAVARAAQAGYAAGRAGQDEPLRAQTELIRLSAEVAALRVERSRAVARLNALLGRWSGTPVATTGYPDRLRHAALADPGGDARFADTTLGALATGSPLPPADALQAAALATSPMIRAHLAELAAQSTRVALAARDARPDPTLSLQYGQRTGMMDMVSATVSVPIPLWSGRKQSQVTAAERATLDALEHEHHRMAAELEAEVLDLVQTAELHRTRLGLYHAGVLPRARAAAEAALAGYRTGRTGFQTVLDTYLSLYAYEADSVRLLTEFAKTVLALEALAGREIVS